MDFVFRNGEKRKCHGLEFMKYSISKEGLYGDCSYHTLGVGRYTGNIIPLTSFPQGPICQHAAHPCSGIEKSS